MCGIVGCAGNISFKEEKMLRTMLILDTVRGEDSTGIAAIPRVGPVMVAKELGNPFELFQSRMYEKAMKVNHRAIIGHNRYATTGGVSKRTAHPFEFDTLVGVHNGTLKNKHSLLDARDFTVDSENLYHHIEQKGLKDALTVLDGAWALVWWEKATESLKFLRNKERPLFMAASFDNKTIFWASEKWMLQVAASRADITLGDIVDIEPDNLYTFQIDDKGVIEKPKVSAAPSTYEPIVYGVYKGGTWTGGVWTPTPAALPPPPANVATVKKPLPLKKRIVPVGSQAYFLGRKDIKLEIMGEEVDEYGASYINLMDPKFPAAPLRVYPMRNDPRSYEVGAEILASHPEFVSRPSGDYFKVSPHGVFFIEEADLDLSDVSLFSDGNGHQLTKKEWEEKFQHCDWCFDPLFAEDHGNRINNTGGCFCGTCASNKDAIEGLALRKVY